MSNDADARRAALEYFERTARMAQRFNEDDTEHYRRAVDALRRSQDHTAIQQKLNGAMRYLRKLLDGDQVNMEELKAFVGEPYVTKSKSA